MSYLTFDLERQPSSFTPKPVKKAIITDNPVRRFQSVRKFYGPNERVYIMDANQVGNIGRYLNVSYIFVRFSSTMIPLHYYYIIPLTFIVCFSFPAFL